MTIDIQERAYLRRCVELARQALLAGDEPFGSVLVSGEGKVMYEDRNRIHSENALYHPEIAVVHWATNNMSAEQRQRATVFTSGEHCPMCAAAQGWAGVGRAVYIHSAEQLGQWLADMGVNTGSAVKMLPIEQLAPNVCVVGPIDEMLDDIKALHVAYHQAGS